MPASPHKHLPSFVTMLNLFAGFLSVIYSIQGELMTAGWLIVIAAVLDAIDGKLARLVKSSSEFGGELDSLADVASFGFAPSVLLYQSFFHQWEFYGILVSFLPLGAGGLRLARFNVESSDHAVKGPFFKGLPIPSAAIVLTAFVMFDKNIFNGYQHIEWLTGLILLVCLLMISNIRYDAPPSFTFRDRRETIKALIVIFILPFFYLYPYEILFPFMLFFIATGLLRALTGLFRKPNNSLPETVV